MQQFLLTEGFANLSKSSILLTLYGTYYAPGTILSSLYILSHLILRMILWSKHNYLCREPRPWSWEAVWFLTSTLSYLCLLNSYQKRITQVWKANGKSSSKLPPHSPPIPRSEVLLCFILGCKSPIDCSVFSK